MTKKPAKLSRDPTLAAAIIANPNDKDAHRVYADWLLDRQDPLGELISLAVAAEDEPKRQRKVKINAQKALARYIESFWVPQFPPLAERFRAWNKTRDDKSKDGAPNLFFAQIMYRWGLIRSLGMTSWPTKMVKPGFALLRHPDCQFIEELTLMRTELVDVSVFAGLRALRTLSLRDTNIESLDVLAGLEHLTKLDCGNTPVKRLGPLAKLPLIELEIGGAPISDLSPLAKITTLESLMMAKTKVSNIEPLLALPNLRSVWMYGTRVSAAAKTKLEKTLRARLGPGLDDYEVVHGP